MKSPGNKVFSMDYSFPPESKEADSVRFKAEFGREAKFYTEVEVRTPGRSESETCWFQHVPGDPNQPPVKAPWEGEWTFYITPTDGDSQFDIDVAQEVARVLPGKILRKITIIRLRPDICLSPVEIVRKGSFRNAKQYYVKFWHWSARWEWFAALLVGGLAFLAVNEFLVGMVLMFLSLLSLCSKLWHTNIRGSWKSLGTVGIAIVLVLFTMSTVAFMEEKPLSNVPVFWSRFVVLRSLTLSPKQPSYPPDLNIFPSTIIPPTLTPPSKSLPPKNAPIEASQRPYDLTGERREKFLKLLNRSQTEPRAVLRIGCLSWSEHACIAAGQFLILFSQAGWTIESNRVFRVDTSIPKEGMNIIKHVDKKPSLPPHLGVWNQMDESEKTIYWAFQDMKIALSSSVDDSIPAGELGIVFGPEPSPR